MTPAVQRLAQAAYDLYRLQPVFRSRPMGAPGSDARIEQDRKINAEDRLLAAIKEVMAEK